MYDKSQLVEQIEKPAELVNGNLKNPTHSGGENRGMANRNLSQ